MQTLAAYIRSVGTLSQASFVAQLEGPVLVESASSDDVNSSSKAFRTEYVETSMVISRVRAPTQREILQVHKRAGAAFSSHVSVGRTPNLDVCIPRPGISKFHAYFAKGADGTFFLTDKDSTNGTFVAGRKLEAGTPTLLSDGVEVRFAKHSFQFMTAARFFDYIRALAA